MVGLVNGAIAPLTVARESGPTREHAMRIVQKIHIGKVMIGSMYRVVLIAWFVLTVQCEAKIKSGAHVPPALARPS